MESGKLSFTDYEWMVIFLYLGNVNDHYKLTVQANGFFAGLYRETVACLKLAGMQ